MMYTFRKAITRALSLCGGVALLTSVVACDSSDLSLDERPANEVTTAKKPVVKFSILKHGNGVSVGADMQEYEDEIRTLCIYPFGEINWSNITKTGNFLKAEWPIAMPLVGNHSLQFVTNLAQSDLQQVRANASPSSLKLNTQDYLRGYNGSSMNTPLVMYYSKEVSFTKQGDDYVYDEEVWLKRVFARFDFQTYSLPNGFKLKQVTVEQVPAKFELYPSTSNDYKTQNTNFPSIYGYLPNGSYKLWDNAAGTLTSNGFASWQESPWGAAGDPKPDMYLKGRFYMPPHIAAASSDYFGTNKHGNMSFLRFVFTDKRNETHVRLYRLGSSDDPSLGSILPSANYQIRINLLGRNQVRDESDTYLKQFDEGTAKAAFLN